METSFAPFNQVKEVIPAQILAIFGTTPRPMVYHGVVPRQHPTQIAITYLGPLTNGATSPMCHSRVPHMPMVFWGTLYGEV